MLLILSHKPLKKLPQFANTCFTASHAALNVVLKKFDWENYIYKCILGAQYVVDHVKDSSRHDHYFRLIADNLDLFNYMLKYPVFRNGEFMINILDIVDEYDLSAILKQKITWRDDLGKDERVGRRVLFEFNKSYPVILFPMLSKKELEPLFFEYLEMYWDEKS